MCSCSQQDPDWSERAHSRGPTPLSGPAPSLQFPNRPGIRKWPQKHHKLGHLVPPRAKSSWGQALSSPPAPSRAGPGFREGSGFIQMHCFSLLPICVPKRRRRQWSHGTSAGTTECPHTPWGPQPSPWAQLQGSQKAFSFSDPTGPLTSLPNLPLAAGPLGSSLSAQDSLPLQAELSMALNLCGWFPDALGRGGESKHSTCHQGWSPSQAPTTHPKLEAHGSVR